MSQIFSQNNNIFSHNGNIFKNTNKISDIDGILLWLESSKKNLIITNNKISKWKDISGKMNHVTQISETNMPSYEIGNLNGYNSLKFNNNDVLSTELTLHTFTIFTVFKSTNNQYIYEFGDDIDNNTGFALIGDEKSIIVNNNGLKSIKTYQDNWGVTGWKVVTHYYNGTHNTHRMMINGNNVLLEDYFNYDDDPAALNITQNLYIGSRNGTSGINGNIAEHIVFNRKLDTSEIVTVNNYLSNKYTI